LRWLEYKLPEAFQMRRMQFDEKGFNVISNVFIFLHKDLDDLGDELPLLEQFDFLTNCL
jgi:hypothetical protein